MKQNINQLYKLVEAENYRETRKLIQNLLEGNKPLAVKFAVKCAYLCLDLFEKQYPKDKRPRKAIEAAEAWLANPTAENQEKASDASVSATNAANAAVSVSIAVSYASYVAANAAESAAANSTYDAHHAAYSAYNAAESYTNKKRKEIWIKCVDIYANLSRKEKLSQSQFIA